MSKLFGKLVGAAIAAAGVYAVGKYLKDYTNYKAADGEDLDALKNGGEKAKEAVRQTYIALKNKEDVTEPAGELGKAVADVAEGAGKLFSSVGTNTVNFAKNEKEKYNADPAAYRAQVNENLKDMGKQAAETISGLKESAENAFQDVKAAAEGVVNDVKATAEGFKDDPEDFVEKEAEAPGAPLDDFRETEEDDFMEEPKAAPVQTKVYANLNYAAEKESAVITEAENGVPAQAESVEEKTAKEEPVNVEPAKEKRVKAEPGMDEASKEEPEKTVVKQKENKEVSGWAEEKITDGDFEISEDTEDLK